MFSIELHIYARANHSCPHCGVVAGENCRTVGKGERTTGHVFGKRGVHLIRIVQMSSEELKRAWKGER